MDDPNNSSVLITGGVGFIGRAVGKLLQRTGYSVISLDQPVLGRSVLNQPRQANAEGEWGLDHVVRCDITNAAQLQDVFESRQIAGIIHLAAILPTAARHDPMRATEVNVSGSLNLLELAQRFGVRRVVFGSSLSIYGTYPAGRVVSERDRAAPEDLYGAAKLYVERLGDAYRRSGVDFVSLRIGRVVGRGARSETSAWRSEIFERLGAKQATEIALPYIGSEKLLLLHVDDAARMLVTLLHAPYLQHSMYNAPCESIAVDALKREVESLNANIRVRLGGASADGNPQALDSSRFAQEFAYQAAPIFEQLKTERERKKF
jgi:nucleoside-diphosphate-sugar epimerase